MDHRVRGFEELLRGLAIGLDHGGPGFPLDRVSDGVQVEAVVGGRMEHVDGIDGSLTRLFIPEHKVNPMVQGL